MTRDKRVEPASDVAESEARTLVIAARSAVESARANLLAAPTASDRRCDLLQALNALGDALQGLGDLTGAHEHYREAYHVAQEHSERRVEASVSLQKIGEVLVAQGDLLGAATALRQGLEVRRQLSKSDRDDLEKGKNVALSIKQLGDILVFKSALSTVRDRSGAGATTQAGNRSVGKQLAHLRTLGDTLEARGDFAGALALFRECVQIQRSLAAQNPGNAGFLLDLSWALGSVGNAHKAHGDFSAALATFSEALTIRRKLADQDAGNRARQLDLSWSLMAIGDVFEAKGDFADALVSYREALKIRRQLAVADPSNNGLQCDLAASLIRIGEILEKQADLASACASYRDALEIARELCAREPGTAHWMSDLTMLQERIDTLAGQLEEVGRAPSEKTQDASLSGPT
jgi:tetratricopeptide (TPR) repeat protein